MASKAFIDLDGLLHYDEKLNEKLDAKYVNLTGNQTISGSKTFSAEIKTSTANAIRIKNGNYGVILRNDSTAFYMLVTASGDADGTWTTARPLAMDLATGVCSINGRAKQDSNGREIATGYMWRGSYERIEGTSSAKKDLNNYKNPGFYNVKTVNTLNCPEGIGIDAVLLNYPWNQGSYLTQEITESAASSGCRRWIRKLNGSTWSEWRQVSFIDDNITGTAANVTGIVAAANGGTGHGEFLEETTAADFNAYTAAGEFHVRFGTDTLNLPVMPSDYLDCALLVKKLTASSNISSNQRCDQIAMVQNPTINTDIAIYVRKGYSSDGFTSSSSWSAWKQIEMDIGAVSNAEIDTLFA